VCRDATGDRFEAFLGITASLESARPGESHTDALRRIRGEAGEPQPDAMTEAEVAKACGWCGEVGASRCSKCHEMWYCCREHQAKHWGLHKLVCGKEGAMRQLIVALHEKRG
jgi:hypothetical protein